MSTPPRRDGPARLLRAATALLPAHRTEWRAAMRAELASIRDPAERVAFAHSAARAAVDESLGIRLGLPLIAGALVAATTVIASRAQLEDAGPGILPITVPVPALILFLVAAIAGALTRSSRVGVETGLWALAASFAALVAVLAVEGALWMDRHGVFILDGDPPKTAIDTTDVILDVFTTGMWIGHVVIWIPALLLGAALGSWAARRRFVSAVDLDPASREHG